MERRNGMTQRRIWFTGAHALACLIIVAASGCGSDDPGRLPTVPAGGTLIYDGKPVAKGTILFQPEKGHDASGVIENGKFTLTTYAPGDGAVVGRHRVAIVSFEETPMKDGDTTAKYLVPQKFSDPGTSGLMAEVPAGGDTNIQLNFK
jgi:hypothetical protein